MKKRICLFLFIIPIAIFAQNKNFSFKYMEGEKYRVLSEVDEQVFIDGVFIQRVSILNKIAIEVDEASQDGGFLKANFQVSEREYNIEGPYQLTEEYYSEYWRDKYGITDIGPQFYMPVVRNVPVFPGYSLKIGDTWSEAGEEVHDLSSLGIKEAFHFPIIVNYKYLGKTEFEDSEYETFSVQYNIFFKPPRVYNAPRYYPVRISGYSDQLVYWDEKFGRPYAYVENFNLIFDFADGGSFEALGSAQAKVVESGLMDKEKLIDEIQSHIDEQGLEDTGVSGNDEGVTITLSDIQFLPDSAILVEDEKRKLITISEILKRYPERDIVVTGHTAMAGTYEGRQLLSVERAKAVGDFLLSQGARDQTQMIIKGVGGTRPIADNSSEEGMKQNRRVEITILEN